MNLAPCFLIVLNAAARREILPKECEMKIIQKTFSIIILFAMMLAVLPTQSVYAATLTVSNNHDSGPGSLRQAIADASSSGGDTITFDGNYTILLTSGTLIIDKNLTIDGTGHTIVLDGNNNWRVLQINYLKTVTLDHLTIRNGYMAEDQGGGIYNYGILTINDCNFSGNTANKGGGLFNFWAGEVTISKSTFSGNTAGDGGGI